MYIPLIIFGVLIVGGLVSLSIIKSRAKKAEARRWAGRYKQNPE